MSATNSVESLPQLYAHALAIEREANLRYREFAGRMDDHDRRETAALFRELARVEADHVVVLLSRVPSETLPEVSPWQHSWLFDAAPADETTTVLDELMRPYHALSVALAAESRARAFFADVADRCPDPETRAAAREMMADEALHIDRVEQALSHEPRPINWDERATLALALM